MDKKIAVIVPVLNRPARVLPLVKSFHESCSREQASMYIVVQRDDAPEILEIQAQAAANPALFNGLTLIGVAPESRSWAKKVNIGLAKTKEPWLLLAGDDVSFKPGWVEALLPVMDVPCVIGMPDPAQPESNNVASAHFMVSREYALSQGTIDGQPVIAHEGYDHNFVDREIALTAYKRGVYRFASACRFIEHVHPLNGTAKVDETYRLGSLRYHEDEALFNARSAQYGLQSAWGN